MQCSWCPHLGATAALKDLADLVPKGAAANLVLRKYPAACSQLVQREPLQAPGVSEEVSGALRTRLEQQQQGRQLTEPQAEVSSLATKISRYAQHLTAAECEEILPQLEVLAAAAAAAARTKFAEREGGGRHNQGYKQKPTRVFAGRRAAAAG